MVSVHNFELPYSCSLLVSKLRTTKLAKLTWLDDQLGVYVQPMQYIV